MMRAELRVSRLNPARLAKTHLWLERPIMTVNDRTPSVTYRQLDWMPGYRFGDDGLIWSRRKCCRWNQLADEWRLVCVRRKPSGHLTIRVTVDGKKTAFYVHRLILEAFVGPCPPGLEACHNDGDPTNNRVSNLRWDTRESNIVDSINHGTFRRARGSRQGRAKLTESDIPMIRELHHQGMTLKDIASHFGVTHQNIRMIISGRTWTHVA